MYSKTFDTYGREKINDIYIYIYIKLLLKSLIIAYMQGQLHIESKVVKGPPTLARKKNNYYV